MLDDQEVRKRRQEKIFECFNTEIENVFEWILTLIDRDTEKENFKPINLVLYKYEDKIKERLRDHSEDDIEKVDTEYDLSTAIKNFGKIQFINKLREFIDDKEGFSTVFNYGEDDDEDLPASVIKSIYLDVYMD